MTAMNVVHMRVKPGHDDEFLRIHREFDMKPMTGSRNFWVTKTGDRSYVIVGEWDSIEAMADGVATVPQGKVDSTIESAEECPGECIFIEITE